MQALADGLVHFCQFGRGLQVAQRALFTNDIAGTITVGKIKLMSEGTTEGQWLFYDANGKSTKTKQRQI